MVLPRSHHGDQRRIHAHWAELSGARFTDLLVPVSGVVAVAHVLRQPSDPNLKGVLAETIAAEAVEMAILSDLLGDV